MSQITEKKVLEIIRRELKLDGELEKFEGLYRNAEKWEWDSLDHLNILESLDRAFEGKIAGIKELATADSVRKIISILKDNSLIKK